MSFPSPLPPLPQGALRRRGTAAVSLRRRPRGLLSLSARELADERGRNAPRWNADERAAGDRRQLSLVDVFLASLRRFVLLAAGVSLATAAVGLLLGLALGYSVDRAMYLGFYWVGAFLLLAGVFVGSRGPVRVKSEGPGSSFVP